MAWSLAGEGSNRSDAWLDDIVIGADLGGRKDDLLGDLRISTLVYTADTGQKDRSLSSGPNNFSRVAEIPPDDDTSGVASATPGHRDLYAMAPLGVTPLAIRGLQQTALGPQKRCRRSGAVPGPEVGHRSRDNPARYPRLQRHRHPAPP